jgi:hypothetical protein
MQDEDMALDAGEADLDAEVEGKDFQQLSALRQRIDGRIREMRETEGPALRERFTEEAAALGLTLQELVAIGKRGRGRPRKEREEE